jgi:hypothetical protein
MRALAPEGRIACSKKDRVGRVPQMARKMKFSHYRYKQAAAKYRPKKTRILFVGEAPPLSADRYFYFEDVKRGDWLWIALMKQLFPAAKWGPTKCERRRKRDWLRRFQNNGYRLIDAVKKPVDGSPSARVKKIKTHSHELISEVKRIKPRCIVLIKATVYDALFHEFKIAGLPVVNSRLPFPSSGRQREFHREFPRKC